MAHISFDKEKDIFRTGQICNILRENQSAKQIICK